MVSVSILSGIILAVRILNNYLVNTLSTLFQRERELEQRAEELQASESRWRSLVYNAPEYIFHLEKDGTILFSNQIYPVNQEEDEHEIHKVYDYVPEEYHQVMKDTLNRVFLHGKKTSCEVRFLSPDGTYRWLSSHAAPITEKGKITSAIVIGNDITEMLELQEQLLQAQKMESIGQLAGGIAHDFNNLLTVINGHAQLAEVNLKNGLPVNEDIQAIQEAGYKAANLTRQILAFSRKEMIQPEKIDLI
jgi:PAS domain S-box-containing protein